MAPIRRQILDPDTEVDITVYEAPYERPEGGVSRRLKAWVFENESGETICQAVVHRTADLGALSEIELEHVYCEAYRSLT